MIGKKPFLAVFFLLLLIWDIGISAACDILIIKSADIKPYNDAIEGFKEAVDCRVKEIDLSDTDESVADRRVRSEDPDLVFAVGMDALTHALRTKDTPLVYTMVPNPQAALSGRRNVNGITMNISAQKSFGAIIDVFHPRRVGIIYNPQATEQYVRDAQQAASADGVELVVRKAYNAADVPALIDGMKDRIDVFWMVPDPVIVNPEAVKYLLLFSFQNKVPVFTFSKKYVEMGGIAALNIVPFDLGSQAGEMAKKIISEGARPPIRIDARKTVLTVNKKVAKKMGVKIRDEVLRKAENAD